MIATSRFRAAARAVSKFLLSDERLIAGDPRIVPGQYHALGEWGTRWLDVAPEDLDPYVALWSMCTLAVDRLPYRRVVVRLDFPSQPKKVSRFWLLIERNTGEVCVTSPGDEDLIITADAERFVRWQMGEISGAYAISDDAIRVDGQRQLVRAFPTWNGSGPFAHIKPLNRMRQR